MSSPKRPHAPIAAGFSPLIPAPETQRLVEDLRVHQFELEMQNDELRRYQSELESWRSKYFDLYELAPVGYCSLDENGLIFDVNLTAARMLGLPRSEVRSRPLSRFVGERDANRYELFRRRLQSSDVPESCDLQFCTHGGASLWMHLSGIRAQREGGLDTLHIALTDISVSVRAEELKEVSERNQALLNAIPDLIFTSNRDGEFLDVKASEQSFLDAAPDRLLGRVLHDVLPKSTADLFLNCFAEALESKTVQDLNYSLLLEGQEKHFEARIAPSTRDSVITIVRDITERSKIAGDLVAAKLNAEKANNSKSRFLAAASHDLRQPLAALDLYVGVLQHQVSAEQHDLICKIRSCCDSLTELLTDLLDISKLEAGVVVPVQSDFSVDEFLEAIVSVHSAEASLKGLSLRWRPTNAYVHSDRKLLTRILNNLISNAIRYTSEGGVLIAFRRHEGKSWLEVWDTGIGIPKDKVDFVFDEFTQIGSIGAAKGSGLGLAIVAKTAGVLGLGIRVRTRLGRGSMFAIELRKGRKPEAQVEVVREVKSRHLRIALVDDDSNVLAAIVLALEFVGHQVISATNEEGLMERLGAQAPDIVISDYRLGTKKTGFDVIKAVRAAFGANLPALIITGDTDPELIRSMARHGIGIQYKPIKFDALLTLVRQAAERRTR